MSRRLVWIGVVVVVVVTSGVVVSQYLEARNTRQALFREFQPVALSNCQIERYGDANDGGYLMCANLLTEVKAAYSYGINGTDEWGCSVSRALNVPVHQYDCFNTTPPPCNDTRTHFNAECVGPKAERIDNRPFDSIASQVQRNGDSGARLVMKMDVEGAEWESLLGASDAVLGEVEQLAVEFHSVENPAYLQTVRRLKQLFHVVNVHQNNFGCEPGLDPFPGSVFEVLFVNKRLGQLAPAAGPAGPHALDAPNAAWLPDCQALRPDTTSSEFALFRRWVRRAVRDF